MIRLILLVLTSSILIANQNNINRVDLFTYAEIVSSATNTNILIDNKVPAKQISFFAPAKLSKNDYILTFKDLLKDCNLRLVKRANYYYVTLPPQQPKIEPKLYKYKFKNLNVSDIQFIRQIFPSIQFQYFKTSNTLYFKTHPDKYKNVINVCKTIDKPYLSKDIQLTIFVTDLEKLKKRGINYEKFGIDFTGLIKLSQNGFNLSTLNVFQFKGLLDLLQDKKIIEVVQNPIIHLTDNKSSTFEVVKNIPVYVSSTAINDNKVTVQENIEYRDIGLKIKIQPRIFKSYILLDLSLTSETIDTLTKTPTTNKLRYSNTFKMINDDAILLSGLNISQKHTETQKIPILSDLPYISPLFKSTTVDKKNQVLSILIESVTTSMRPSTTE